MKLCALSKKVFILPRVDILQISMHVARVVDFK